MMKTIDIEERALKAGYRNFKSYVFIRYFGEENPIPMRQCGGELGVSYSKFKSCLVERGWSPKSRSQCVRPKPKKRRLYIWAIVKRRTKFIFPWCAIHIYYWKFEMTTHEIAKALGVSQFYILKLMKRYKIKRRRQGV